MKTKTSELIGAALDWAVAKCSGISPAMEPLVGGKIGLPYYAPSTDWSQGGPIIEREKMGHTFDHDLGHWAAWCKYVPGVNDSHGPTPLVADMRAYVAFKLGDEVDVPEELL